MTARNSLDITKRIYFREWLMEKQCQRKGNDYFAILNNYTNFATSEIFKNQQDGAWLQQSLFMQNVHSAIIFTYRIIRLY